MQQCIRDADILNLTLYSSEIVGAVLETTFKATDVPLVVQFSAVMHRRYEEYTTGLIGGLRSSLLATSTVAPSSSAAAGGEDDKELGKKKRIQIRFAIELFQAGVWEDEAFFLELLRLLLGKSKRYNLSFNAINVRF